MIVNDLLDSEVEALLRSLATPGPTKKRKKVIGLDDLLNDHKKEEEKNKKKKAKAAKSKRRYISDDEDRTEKELSKAVENFQQMIKEIDGANDISNILDQKDATWGLPVFGTQKTFPSPQCLDLGNTELLQASLSNEFSQLIDLDVQKGETYLKGLLINNLLWKFILQRGHLEESVARWTFNLLVHSSEEPLRASACDFWCAILCYEDENPLQVDWFPSYSQLKTALESYGFLLYAPTNSPSDVDMCQQDFDCKVPPSNVRAWIKFINVCFQVRRKYQIFSISEAEELLGAVGCLFLDRRLQGMHLILYECLLSAICYFEEGEWGSSYRRVSKFLVDRVPMDLNCLKLVDSIPGVDTCSRILRSVLAFEILRARFPDKVTAEAILRYLISINMKDKGCDLFQVYLNLVLIQNWLILGIHQDNALVADLWGAFLRNCCSQITNTDFRSYSQEVRNRASYLLQQEFNN